MPPITVRLHAALTLTLLSAAACANQQPALMNDHGSHAEAASATASTSTTTAAALAVQDPSIPPSAATAEARLAASPRHAEWTSIRTSPTDSVMAWVVYPERSTKAPVVIVIHEIFGLSTWIRGVADQLAADGFIAIAPDLLTMKRSGDLTSEWSSDSARAVIRTLDDADVQRDLDAVAKYGMALPAALPAYGVVGYCWGGSTSFEHAVHAPGLGAAVVYYGSSPASSELASVKAPVLGLYGGNDARVNSTIPAADSTMKALGKRYEHTAFDGAGHGFLRQQDGRDGANLRATQRAWPMTIAFFRQHLDG